MSHAEVALANGHGAPEVGEHHLSSTSSTMDEQPVPNDTEVVERRRSPWWWWATLQQQRAHQSPREPWGEPAATLEDVLECKSSKLL